MDRKELTPELQEKLKECKTPEELIELAKREGYELTDEQIESISGGGGRWSGDCEGFKPKPIRVR